MNILQRVIRNLNLFTGTYNEKLLKYFKYAGATSSVLQDAEKQYLIGKLGNKAYANQDCWKELEAVYGTSEQLIANDVARANGAVLYTVHDNYAGSLYQDSAGSTQASVDGSVGLVLDAAGSVGAELVTSTSGVAGVYNGMSLVEDTTTTNHYVQAAFNSPANRTQFKVKAKAGSKSWIWMYFANYTAGSAWFDLVNGVVGFQEAGVSGTIKSLGGGEYECTLTKLNSSASTNGAIVAVASNASTAAYLGTGTVAYYARDISAKEVIGTHATQATTANKPTLVRGLYNLLTYSNDLTNAAWVAQGTANKSGQVLNLPSSGGGDAIFQSNVSAAGKYTYTLILSGAGTVHVWGYNATDGNLGYTQVTLTATPTLYVVNYTSTAANTSVQLGRPAGDTATSVTFGGAGLFAGTLTAQQILANGGIPLTTSAAGWNQTAGRHLLSFDGVNDTLTFTPQAITTQATLVWAGTIAGAGAFVGQAAGGLLALVTANGQVLVGNNSANFVTSGTGAVALNTPAVISVTVQTGGTSVLRVNGVQVGSAVNAQPSMNQASMALMSMAGASSFTPGAVGFCEVSNTILSLADLQAAERAAAKSVGVEI